MKKTLALLLMQYSAERCEDFVSGGVTVSA